jgi:general secretion pathway protein G
MNPNQKNQGFTLIELLVVISIIGLLSSVVLTNVSTAKIKAEDAARIALYNNIKTALILYYNDNQTYPCAGTWCEADPISDSSVYAELRSVLPSSYINLSSQKSYSTTQGNYGWYTSTGQNFYMYFYPKSSSLANKSIGCQNIVPGAYCIGDY